MAAAADRFGLHMPEVAKLLLGDPNPSLSTKTELRFGAHGSVSVDLEKGAAFDHSAGEGGGVLWLVKRETGYEGSEAIGWMERQGLYVEDDRYAPPTRRSERAAPVVSNGADHAQEAMRAARRRPPVATYDYVDESGDLLFQACRYEWEHAGERHKTFSQRRRPREGDEPEKVRDGWVQSIRGERMVPYRLLEMVADRDAGWIIFLVEGEKDVDNLRALDVAATCNPMGAGKWWPELTQHFAGADVVILPDNDDPGRKHAERVAAEIHGTASRVRLLELPDLPLKGDASDWLRAGGGREALIDLVEARARDWRPPAPARESRFNRISFNFEIAGRGSLRTRQAKAIDWKVDDWMAGREVSFLAGESEAGKTFLALDVAMRTALGWPVFGRRTKPGLVIYQIGESADGLIDLRLQAWRHQFGAELPELVPFEVLASKVNLWTTDDRAKDGVAELLSAIKGICADYPDLPLSAVYIDTWSKAFTGGNENDGRDVSRVISNAEMIARETGAHVALIHHFPKGGATLRGHGSLKADVHAVAMVSTDKDSKVRTIRFDQGGKLKDGEKSSMQFELMKVTLGEREGDGKPITSCVVLPVGEKAAARAEVPNSVRLSTDEMGLFQALWKAVQQYGAAPHVDLDCSPNIRVAPYEEVRKFYVDASPMQDAETYETEEAREDARRRHAERLRKQMQRACAKLVRQWKVLSTGQAPDPDTGRLVHFAWWTGRPVRGMPQTYPPKPKEDSAPAAAEGLRPDDII